MFAKPFPTGTSNRARFAIAYNDEAKGQKCIRVVGSECYSREGAETLAADRAANGESFAGEYVIALDPVTGR